MMHDALIDVKVLSVEDGNPVVFGELRNEGTEKCLGFYNHYDVQPPEPLKLWDSPPFEADVRGGKIYAKGSQITRGTS